MAANKSAKTFRPLALAGMLMLSLLSGCDRSETLRRGSWNYNAADVFGEGTPEFALAKAAGGGDVKEVNRLVAGGANVNAIGRHGITPLWWAACLENYEGFAGLLKHGANPNHQRPDGYPIMHLIASSKDGRLLKAALEHGGDPNLRDSRTGETPLFPAVMHDCKAQIDLLLATKSDVNARDPISGDTVLMVAIGVRADYELVHRLLQMGADPTLKTKNGHTLADVIALVSINSTKNDDPYRAKVLAFLESKGVAAKPKTAR